MVALGSAYFILDFNPNLFIFLNILAIFIVYYNTVLSLYTCLFSTRLGRPEARAFSFLLQAFLAITSGLWIHSDDTIYYDAISWISYINPMYWTLNALNYLNAQHLGPCVAENAMSDSCGAATGDYFLSQLRFEDIEPWKSLIVILGMWLVIRLIQLCLLAKQAHRNLFFF